MPVLHGCRGLERPEGYGSSRARPCQGHGCYRRRMRGNFTPCNFSTTLRRTSEPSFSLFYHSNPTTNLLASTFFLLQSRVGGDLEKTDSLHILVKIEVSFFFSSRTAAQTPHQLHMRSKSCCMGGQSSGEEKKNETSIFTGVGEGGICFFQVPPDPVRGRSRGVGEDGVMEELRRVGRKG